MAATPPHRPGATSRWPTLRRLFGKTQSGKIATAAPYPGVPEYFRHKANHQLHQGMFSHRENPDALGATLDELLAGCRLLCFDEFHVHDIGDAMLITRLFKALFQRQVLLVVTSNYPPEGLLPNPLYHARFKPVIDLINARMEIMEVGGPHDYRSLAWVPDTSRCVRTMIAAYVSNLPICATSPPR